MHSSLMNVFLFLLFVLTSVHTNNTSLTISFNQRADFTTYWVEKILITNPEFMNETASVNHSSAVFNNQITYYAQETLPNKCSILAVDNFETNSTIVELEFEKTGVTQNLYLHVNSTKISINSELVWSLENCSLQNDDHVKIEGKTIEFKIYRIFQNYSVQLTLFWTPLRDIITTQFIFHYNTQSNNSRLFNVRLNSRDGPKISNELQFYSIERNISKPFSEVYERELREREKTYGLEFDVNITGLTNRRASCQLWRQISDSVSENSQEINVCDKVSNACNFAAYFVRKGDFFRVPNFCLACSLPSFITKEPRIARFGNRNRVHGFKVAEIVYLLDGSCHRVKNSQATFRIIHQLHRLSKVIEKDLRSKDIRVRVMSASPDLDGDFLQHWSQPDRYFIYTHLLSRESHFWKSNHQLNTDRSNMNDPFMQATWRTSGRSTMDFLSQFPYPPDNTVRHFVLLDCLHFDNHTQRSTCETNQLDFSSARNMLLHSNTYLHLITGMGTSPRNVHSSKFRFVVGIDWNRTYFDNTTLARLSKIKHSSEELTQLIRPHILPHRDHCHFLALETNGTIFNHNILKQSNRAIFSERISSYFVQNSNPLEHCQKCDCLLDKDKMFARQECVRCRDREHTIPINSMNASNDSKQGIVQQEWTSEDEYDMKNESNSNIDWKDEVDEHL